MLWHWRDLAVRQSRPVARKDAQLVLRLPAALVEAVKAHRDALQRAEPYSNVTLAEAARDLLLRGLGSAAKPSKRR